MSTNRGIFESFPSQAADPKDSPFAIVNEPAESTPAASPFVAVTRQDSPFAFADEGNDSPKSESGSAVATPEGEKTDFPFQEPSEGFGFEAPAKKTEVSPFEAASDTAREPARGISPSTQAALAAFGTFQDAPAPAQAAASPFASSPAAEKPASPAASVEPATFDESLSDSYSIRQLELRAVFGVDREMTTEEILQRSRALPGIRNIARVSSQDMGTIEGLKKLLPNLGFGSGGLKLYVGSVPLDFIREGAVLLAVQTDGGFAPGVRETLMLVARELGRM